MSGGKETSIFTDLTPIDNADPDGSYSKALSFAFENPRIKNIAITGPYGSGKSSIIRTYEKNSTHKFLNISLASFKEDNSIDTSLIERSILQQMLYGADANKLPYSRFKRISTPTWPLVKAMFLVLWPIILFFLYQYRNELLNIESFSLTWFFLILLIEFSVLFPVILVSNIYKASFGLSLKKFSLKNAEIETGELPENSILNRHLDEIIYFFQVTDYDVVVIEDLDRFGDPEIFVKLREINKLINDNKKACKQVKFLYALKDDMFAHKNRAKFFDFIIPVVPVINSSNSLDMMQKRLKEHDFATKVDTQFLREVSLYIDDLRLVHNIFNEFVIYYQRLKSDSLDVTKLLAMMIYKNVYPSDFENLHHGNGALFEICKKRVEYLQKSKEQLKGEQEEIRALIKLANNEEARNIRALIDTYIGHIVMHVAINQPVFGIVCNNQSVALSAFITLDQFTPLLSEKNIQIATQPQNHPHYRVTINKSFSQIEEEINPGETVLSRKKNIENNTEAKKVELQEKIQRIDKKIAELSQLQLYQLLQINDIGLDDLIKKYEIIDSELLVFLVKEGYLDDNYHFYISNFHEGRLSKNDRDYLLTIRNFKQPDPNQKIDTPKEVCANMREEDFGHKYVLNVTLIDYLLESNDPNSKRIKSAIGYISKKIESAEEFFSAYFFSGKHLDKFINNLSREWPEIAVVAISSKHEAELISYILRFVNAEYVSENMNSDNLLTEYLSQQGYLVFASDLQLPDDYNVLKTLDVFFHDLTSLDKNKDLLEFAYAECLYAITTTNVNFILETFADPENIEAEKANYTSILSSGSKCLKRYIEANLPNYIEKVFLTLPSNIEESGATIKVLINNKMIDDDLSKKIISKQDNVFNSFDGIPENLWSHLLLEEKVVISWKNISEYLKSDGFDEPVVTELLNRQNIVEPLSNVDIPIEDLGEDEALSLSSFIFRNNKLTDPNYFRLIKCLPYEYRDFPTDMSEEKIKCLANEKTVILTEDSFNFAGNDGQLVATLISNDFNTYFEQQEIYAINDDVRKLLLLSEINNENKVAVCLNVTPQGARESEKLSQLIANVLVVNDVDCSKVDDDVLSSAIVSAQNVSDSISIFMKCLPKWGPVKVMEVIADLPKPFSEISVYGKRPKIDNNKVNLEFAKLLEEKGYISSMKEKGDSVIINTFKSSDF